MLVRLVCGCRAALAKGGKLAESLLGSVFSIRQQDKAARQKHHSLECYSWSIYQSISNENKTIVLNVSPALNLEN